MFGKPKLKPLTPDQVPAALNIINAHDEDDAAWAKETYEDGLFGQFGFVHKGTLGGVTGFKWDGDIAWISWTYLHPQARGQGMGEEMLNQLLKIMRKDGVRKAFVATSDYAEPGEEPLYARAIRLYEKAGFQLELTHPNYYDKGESELIYGLQLKPKSGNAIGQSIVEDDAPAPELTEVFSIDETETCYAIEWADAEEGAIFDASKLNHFARHAADLGATSVFISFPSSRTPGLAAALSSAGFSEEGRLRDFHGDGIDEIRYRRDI